MGYVFPLARGQEGFQAVQEKKKVGLELQETEQN